MYVMAEEPIPNNTASDVRNYFADKCTEQDLADAYALTNNKFWWVEDNVYDFDEGTPEYEEACAISDEWYTLMDEYEKRIFEVLTRKGILIPKTKRITVLAPFMKKYGYIDANGWWVKG